MKQLLNDQWQFVKLAFGSTLEEAEKANWQDVDLPHDWLIWQTDDLYETADAWYRRVLHIADARDGLCRRLRFDGVYMDCDILVNGQVVCSHAYGYTAFDADLTDALQSGDNIILVHIRHQSPNTRWYSGSGIYRDVELVTVPACHFVPDGTYVVSRPEGNGWKINIESEIAGERNRTPITVTLQNDRQDVLFSESFSGSENRQKITFHVENVEPWSLEVPVLYTLTCDLGTDQICMRIGFRTTEFTTDRGFFLNGKHIKLKGVCLHHDLGALGAAFHEKAARRQLRIMKDMGVNALRTSHNPPAAKMLDLCDEMGILVIDEAFDMWERPKTEFDYARFFDAHEAEDVASWVRRDRNHACVIMWSIGNEIYDMFADDRGREVTRMLMEQARSHDPKGNAVVTFGSNYMPWEGAQKGADIVKIPGYNYGEKFYEEHHKEHPDWVIYGSETASILASRGIYHFPAEVPIMSEEDLQCSDLGNSTTSWGARDMRHCIVDDLNTPYSLGQFIWSGIDYIGEPTPYHTRNCYFGQADTAGFPKDVYYLFRSIWNDEKMIHIGMRWDWNPKQMIDVRVMSNANSVELYLNGASLGRQTINLNDPEQCCPGWKIPYEAGELRAIGYDASGNVIVEEVKHTPADAAKIILKSEDASLEADGHDMTFIKVTVEDAYGNPVENANNRIHISVEGNGCLLGMDNGDSTDLDPYKTDSRRLFSGKLLVMIGALERNGDITVRAESEGLPVTTLTIPTVPSEHKEGYSRSMRITGEAKSGDRPIRKIEILPLEGTHMDEDHRTLAFGWRTLPANAVDQKITWQVTNVNGIVSPSATVSQLEDRILVHAEGDGEYYLRASCNNGADHPVLISQIELQITGLGMAELDPYQEVTAGLYDFSEGEIGSGNGKGIAFARFGRSLVGFSKVKFGPVGTDKITLPLFALNDEMYQIEMFVAQPGQEMRLLTVLNYQKHSIWNTYQSETWTLPERLTGVLNIAFAMTEKVHMRSFIFEKQSRAFIPQKAADADSIYGDHFVIEDGAVKNIGNNVSLLFKNMDFGEIEEAELSIDAETPLEANAITVRMMNSEGKTLNELVSFIGTERHTQSFRLPVTPKITEVAFVFLPGSNISLYGFKFGLIQK